MDIEAACDAIGLKLLEQHGASDIWDRLENSWSTGLVELMELLEVEQLVSILEGRGSDETSKQLSSSKPNVPPRMMVVLQATMSSRAAMSGEATGSHHTDGAGELAVDGPAIELTINKSDDTGAPSPQSPNRARI
jgi:hypothetical protein